MYMYIGSGCGWTFVFHVIVYLAYADITVHARSELEACVVCRCDRELHFVNCANNGLRELPTGIPIDTEVLYLNDNFLREIPYRGLLKFKNLTRLFVFNNSITKPFELPESVTILMANINHIQDIKPLMRNGVKLQSVNLRENKLRILETDTFKRCTKLESLYLENNYISRIEQRGLAGPENLATLFLKWNNLTDLGPPSTEGLHCQYLYLQWNDLRVLKPYTFGTSTDLGAVDIKFNQLEEIPFGLFLHPPTEHPNIEHNREVYSLRIDSNKITRISPGALLGVKRFTIISMSNNKLVSIPEDLFVNTTISGTIDISSNRLTSIPDGLLRGQNALKNLYLERNQIRALNSKMFKGLRSLKELMIFNNPLTEVTDWLFYETKLTNLYMFQTNLTSIGMRPFATSKNTIKQLSLYGNKLEHIADVVWHDLGIKCFVAIDNILKYAPATNRTDLKIELVDDGFAQPIPVPKDVAILFNRSGFACIPVEGSLGNVWQCTPCPQGFYGASWIDACLACPPGGFYQIKTGQVADEATAMNCQVCNNGTYVTHKSHPGTSPADCVVCPTGTNKALHAGFRACPCLDDYYRRDRFGECYPCPAEGLNCTGEYQHLLPGFWWTWDWGSNTSTSYKQFVQNVRTENTSYSDSTQTFFGLFPKVYPCPRRESCVDVGDGITATCENGYEGWLCSQCSTGFYSWFDNCFECPKWWWFMLEIIAAFVVVAVIVTVIVWNLRRDRSGRSIADVILARGKILLGFYQVMGEIFSALDEIPWPLILTKVGSFFKLMEVNIMQLLISPRCYFPDFTYPNIYIEFLVGIGFVIGVAFFTWCFYSFRKCFLKLQNTHVEERTALLSETKEKCYLVVVMLLFVSYPSLSGVILTLLPSGCDLFYLDENESLNVTRLRSDYSINCDTQQHFHFNSAAEAALCYVVGFPSVLFLLLWWSNKRQKDLLHPRETDERSADSRQGGSEQHLRDVAGDEWLNDDSFNSSSPLLSIDGDDATPSQPENEALLATWKPNHDKISWKSFLCENYKPQFWYWEIVELARKILQTLFVLLFGPEDPFTLFATIVISVGFLLIHAYVRPMKDAAEHRLQMFSLGTIFLNLLAASLLLLPTEQNHSSELRKEILAVAIVLLNLSIIVLVAASLIWTGVKALRRHGCCGHMAACTGRLCCWYCRQRGQRVSERNINRPDGDDDGEDSTPGTDVQYTDRPYADVIVEHHSF